MSFEAILKIVTKIIARKDSEIFREPVPWEEIGLTDYLQIVKVRVRFKYLFICINIYMQILLMNICINTLMYIYRCRWILELYMKE
jgi:hypothetical protein